MSESTKYVAKLLPYYWSEHRSEAAAIKALKQAEAESDGDERGEVIMFGRSGLHRSHTVVYPVAGRTWSN